MCCTFAQIEQVYPHKFFINKGVDMLEKIIVNSTEQNQLIDITKKVKNVIQKSSIQNGVAYLFVPHTTAAITINENAGPDVKTDFIFGMNKVSPDRKEFRHLEGNSAAHIKSSLIGCEQIVIIENGELLLGIWQGIYFCEFDGPRTRKLMIKIMEEK